MEILKLKQWFLEKKRDLPWRHQPSPYAVWVSEIMLQQTQVAVVIPYFERWMELFPTIQALADADLDQVIKAWEGLGYYSRARNLHAGAQQVVQQYKGIFPDNEEELKKIKGIGPYTLGAILSFAFHQKKAAVDGNVIRVLSRYENITDDVCKPKTVQTIRDHVENILPENESWIISEALIELGAAVCTKAPKCQECPLRQSCKAFKLGTEKQLPFKGKKTETLFLQRGVAVVTCGNKVLLRKGEAGKIMSDLYEFPYVESIPDVPTFIKSIKKDLKLSVKHVKDLSIQKHSFTKYQVTLQPFHFESSQQHPDQLWVEKDVLTTLPFSSGHRKVLHDFLFNS